MARDTYCLLTRKDDQRAEDRTTTFTSSSPRSKRRRARPPRHASPDGDRRRYPKPRVAGNLRGAERLAGEGHDEGQHGRGRGDVEQGPQRTVADESTHLNRRAQTRNHDDHPQQQARKAKLGTESEVVEVVLEEERLGDEVPR